MKNILVPTDFSACAGNAVEAAVKLAKKFNAIVYLYHNVTLPSYLEELTEKEKEHDSEVIQLMLNADVLLASNKDKFDKSFAYPIVRRGNLIKNIQDIVKTKEIDMIVMGSHGTSGKSEFFIGSNTQKVVRTVHCPVLVLKEPLKKVDFDKIVYASNFNLDERHSMVAAKNFIKHFLPKEIHLLTIHTSEFFGAPYVVEKAAMDDCSKLFKPFKVRNHIYRDFTVSGGIQNFVKENQPDLLIVSNHNRRPLKRMIAGSNVEMLINHVDVPVLSIDYTIEPVAEDMQEVTNLSRRAR